MLASLRILPVMTGVALGGLAATALAFLFWVLLAVAGLDDAPLAGLTAGIVLGFLVCGAAAGRSAPHTHRFHGAVAGLAMATVVFVVALLGGSPAPITQILLLLGLGMVLGGAGGSLGGRRRRTP